MPTIVGKENINMPEDYSAQRGRGGPRGGPRGGGWDGVERRRGGGRRRYDRRRRRPRFFYPPFFYPRPRCDYFDRYGRCCDRYGRCYNMPPYPRYYPMGNPEAEWEEAQMDQPMLMASEDDDMYYEE